jgi:hypothetical protein
LIESKKQLLEAQFQTLKPTTSQSHRFILECFPQADLGMMKRSRLTKSSGAGVQWLYSDIQFWIVLIGTMHRTRLPENLMTFL